MSTDVTANYHGGDAFSAAAFESTPTQRRALDRARIETSIYRDGPATCEEIEARLGMSHQTCSARITELRRDGKIIEVGKGLTKTGRSARIHGPALPT